MTVYVNFHFHLNMFYAEYSDEEVIRRFPNVYRALLDFLENHSEVKAGWDIEASRSIDFLRRVAPDVIDRLNNGIERGQFEVLLDTWCFSLPTLHTEEEFDFQHRLAEQKLRETFKHVSKGYFAQEGSYHPALPRFLRRNGVEYYVVQMSAVRNWLRDVSGFDHRMHELVGFDGSTIPCVLFVTGIVEDPVGKIRDMKDTEFGDVLVVILEDAEVLRTDVLESYISEFEKLDYVKYALCSEFVRSAKVGRQLDAPDLTWVPGAYDYVFWVRDPWDQHLWTLNELARQDIREAEFWIRMARSRGIDVAAEEAELIEARKWALLGQNSDKFGWNPCAYKRVQGEYECRYASEIARIAGAVASEKIFSQVTFDFSEETVKRFLVFNYHRNKIPLMPVNIGVRVEEPGLRMEEIVMWVKGEVTPTDLTIVKLHPDGTVSEANLVYVGGFEAEEIVPVEIVRGEPELKGGGFTVSEKVLGNGLVELHFEEGVPMRLVDKSTGLVYGVEGKPFMESKASFGDEQFLEDAPSLEVTNSGSRGVFAEVKLERKLTESSSVSTRFRVYRGLHLLEVESHIDVKGRHFGRIEPLNLRLGIDRPRKIWRDLGGHVVSREIKGARKFNPLVNDWVALANDNKGIIVAGDGKVRSFKEFMDAKREIGLFRAESIFKSNPMEAFQGTYSLKCMLIPFSGTPSEELILLARCCTSSPGIVAMTRYEGFRKI